MSNLKTKGEKTMLEQNLKNYLKEHGYNVSAVAEKSGVGRRLQRVVNEGAKLRADDLIKITKVLGIKVEDLINE